MTEEAIRHPKRGKVHRPSLATGTPSRWFGDTACGKFARDMTDRIPLDQVPHADRCRRCWPKEEA